MVSLEIVDGLIRASFASVADATTYTVIVYSDSEGTNALASQTIDAPGATGDIVGYTFQDNFGPGTYYIKVVPANDDLSVATCGLTSIVIPAPVVLACPIVTINQAYLDTGTVIVRRAKVSWTAVDMADYYIVKVYTDADHTILLQQSAPIVNPREWNFNGTVGNTYYFKLVPVSYDHGSNGNCDVVPFTITDVCPVLHITPASESIDIVLTYDSSMLWYDINLYTTPTGGTPFRSDIYTSTKSKVTLDGLTPSTNYYIQAIPRTSANVSVTDCDRIPVATPAAFNPDNIPGIWARFESNNGFSRSNSDGHWTDVSLSGNNVYADVDAANNVLPPVIYDNALNGFDVIGPDITNGKKAHLISQNNLPDNATSGMTILMVASQSLAAAPLNSLNGIYLASGTNVVIKRSGPSGIVSAKIRTTTSVSESNIQDDTFYTFKSAFDPTGNSQEISINGGSAGNHAVTDLGTYVPSPFEIFNGAAFGDNPGNCKIAEIIVIMRHLDSTEVNQVETYLKNKYNHF